MNTDRQPQQRLSWSFSFLVLVCAGLGAYSNTLQVPFLFDDLSRIVEEPAVRQIGSIPELMSRSNRPLAMATFALNYAVHGYRVWGYHATNTIIHLFSGLLLWGVLRRTFEHLPERSQLSRVLIRHANRTALVIALLWLVHPLQTQAVTYIVQRLESLMGMAYLATIYLFVRGARSSRSRWWLLFSLLACSVGMGCKEVMVTAPIMVLWYDRVFVAASWRELWTARWGYYLGLFASWSILAWSMLHYTVDYTSGALVSVSGMTPGWYLWNQSAVLVHYLRLSVWPVDQCFYYQWPLIRQIVPLLPTVLTMVGLVLATVVAMFRAPRLGFVGGWFFAILAPTSSVVPIQDLAFEHRMYLPLAAVVTLLVLLAIAIVLKLFQTATTRTALAGAAAVGVAVMLCYATIARNEVYRTAVSLWKQTVEVAPWNAGAWTNLGLAFKDEERFSEAAGAFKTAVELKPDDVATLASYGGVLIEAGELELAELQLQSALQLSPDHYLTVLNLGNLEFARQRYAEAIGHLQAALLAKPENNAVRLCLAASLINTGQFMEAEEHCRQALRSEPGSSDAWLNLACALGGQGETQQAIAACHRALEGAPDSANAHGTLALLLAPTNPAEARQLYSRAAQLETALPTFDLALAQLVLRTSPQDALDSFQAALRKQPDSVEAHLGLADAYTLLRQPELAIEHLEYVATQLPHWPELQLRLRQLKKAAAAE